MLRSPKLLSLLACACVVVPACGAEPPPSVPQPYSRLTPLHTRMGKPEPGEWLAQHEEFGQTYDQYLRSRPVRPDKKRHTLYIQPLGTFTDTQRKIVHRTAEYMGIYFNVPVKIRDDLSLDAIPEKARRTHPTWDVKQILSTYVLDEVLEPCLPDDALALIAFTTSDLWPGEGWNFVFGQASLQGRVGVWSLARYGDPDESKEAYQKTLVRAIKVGTHETGHMLSMSHCIYYRCNMAGSNHLAEMDRAPLWLCPICLAKLCWATGADPAERFARLAAFCRTNDMPREQEFFERSLAAIRGK